MKPKNWPIKKLTSMRPNFTIHTYVLLDRYSFTFEENLRFVEFSTGRPSPYGRMMVALFDCVFIKVV